LASQRAKANIPWSRWQGVAVLLVEVDENLGVALGA
jgi:hypothetical protein